MNFFPKKFICVFCFSIFFASACTRVENVNVSQSQNNQSANNNAQIVNDDVEELGKIIKLPLAPEEATWREDNLNAQAAGESKTSAQERKKLTAVLRFTDEDTAKIVAQTENNKSSKASEVEAEDWFPAELVAQSQLSGDETLQGSTFPADDFFQLPYAKGNITRINNTNYFVLELTTF